MLTGTSHLPLASVPSVACDNHAQLVSKVLHLMNLSKGSRMVDLIQAFHHVRLIAEDMEHKGTLAGRSAVLQRSVRCMAQAEGRRETEHLYRSLLPSHYQLLPASSRAVEQPPAQQCSPGWQHLSNTASKRGPT